MSMKTKNYDIHVILLRVGGKIGVVHYCTVLYIGAVDTTVYEQSCDYDYDYDCDWYMMFIDT